MQVNCFFQATVHQIIMGLSTILDTRSILTVVYPPIAKMISNVCFTFWSSVRVLGDKKEPLGGSI